MDGLKIGVGVDFGTSGVRATVIRENGEIIEQGEKAWGLGEERKAAYWFSSLESVLEKCPSAKLADRIAVSGTSGTLISVSDDLKKVTREASMYNDAISNKAVADFIDTFAPPGHVVRSKTSPFTKMLDWHIVGGLFDQKIGHQADFVASTLCGSAVMMSDWHNALKLGFDVETLSWPDWYLEALKMSQIPASVLPVVIEPGSFMGKVTKESAERYHLKEGASVMAGTTDSIAAFFACTYKLPEVKPGLAVTSLGSTTALKLLSSERVDDAVTGVYSHRFDNDLWLVGGASNAGTIVLRSFGFDNDELRALSSDETLLSHADISPDDYYPLTKKGERFPINDPDLLPRLPDKDDFNNDRRRLLANLLVSIARVEQRGYQALADLGASTLTSVATAGGGAANEPWRHYRSTQLGVPVIQAEQTDAAFGAAVLALRK